MQVTHIRHSVDVSARFNQSSDDFQTSTNNCKNQRGVSILLIENTLNHGMAWHYRNQTATGNVAVEHEFTNQYWTTKFVTVEMIFVDHGAILMSRLNESLSSVSRLSHPTTTLHQRNYILKWLTISLTIIPYHTMIPHHTIPYHITHFISAVYVYSHPNQFHHILQWLMNHCFK